MPQSFSTIIVHTVFSTKYRQSLIDGEIEPRLHAIMVSEFQRYGSRVIRIGGTPDHVHIIHTLPRDRPVSQLIQAAKAVSSKWIKSMGDRYRGFAWQVGYASFSVDYRRVDGLIRYVDKQKQHHGLVGDRMAFEEEYLNLLNAFGVSDYDLNYLFPLPPAA